MRTCDPLVRRTAASKPLVTTLGAGLGALDGALCSTPAIGVATARSCASPFASCVLRADRDCFT